MQYATHYEEGKKVSFKKFDLNLAGLLFLPDGFDADAKYPAVVVTHPGGGVKEQCSSLYAWHLARAGYVALAFDASHQGESEGLPGVWKILSRAWRTSARLWITSSPCRTSMKSASGPWGSARGAAIP